MYRLAPPTAAGALADGGQARHAATVCPKTLRFLETL